MVLNGDFQYCLNVKTTFAIIFLSKDSIRYAHWDIFKGKTSDKRSLDTVVSVSERINYYLCTHSS